MGGFDCSYPFFKSKFQTILQHMQVQCYTTIYQLLFLSVWSASFIYLCLLHFIIIFIFLHSVLWIQSSIYLEHIPCEWFLMNKKITLFWLLQLNSFGWDDIEHHSALCCSDCGSYSEQQDLSPLSQIWKLGFIISH